MTDGSSLSAEVAQLMQDKHSLASNALDHFADWDGNKDGSLSVDELNNVVNSQLSLQDRATASILAQNFENARNLNTESMPKDLNGLSDKGQEYLQSVFAGDTSNGITHNDLNLLSMLANVSDSISGQSRRQGVKCFSVSYQFVWNGKSSTIRAC